MNEVYKDPNHLFLDDGRFIVLSFPDNVKGLRIDSTLYTDRCIATFKRVARRKMKKLPGILFHSFKKEAKTIREMADGLKGLLRGFSVDETTVELSCELIKAILLERLYKTFDDAYEFLINAKDETDEPKDGKIPFREWIINRCPGLTPFCSNTINAQGDNTND